VIFLGCLRAGGWTPVISTHHLPTTLRSLAFVPVQGSDAHVFFRGENVIDSLSLEYIRPGWSFVREMPPSLTHLRLMTDAHHLLHGLETLKQCGRLEELDVHVGAGPNLKKCVGAISDSVATALAGLGLKRVGLHNSIANHCLYVPDFSVPQTHRTFDVGIETYLSTLEEQIDDASRRSITKLRLHALSIPFCPSLSGCSVLKELVIGDMWRNFDHPCSTPFSLTGLDAVAATLRHLTLSSSREETCVELPRGLRLRSFVCVCSGSLLLHCDARMLVQGLMDVLLGYTSISGTGARLVEDLAPRLRAAVLEVHGFKSFSQSVLFTRAELVGEWWYGVFQLSKQQRYGGCFCCRVRVWAQGCLCPPYLTFLRYGILSAHGDRDVLSGYADEPIDEGFKTVYPDWHYT
jgi:hypothetical protein